jgi:hypothetical protein
MPLMSHNGHGLTVKGMTTIADVLGGPPIHPSTGARRAALGWLAVGLVALALVAVLTGVRSSSASVPGAPPRRAPMVQPSPPSSEQLLSSQPR